MALAVSSGPQVKNTRRYTSTSSRVFLHVVVLNEVHIHSTFTLNDLIHTGLRMYIHMCVQFCRVLTTEHIILTRKVFELYPSYVFKYNKLRIQTFSGICCIS
jgi:hypothetical protein